jgi:hypothetical protein
MGIAEVLEAVLAVPPTTNIVSNHLDCIKNECKPILYQAFLVKLQQIIEAVEICTRERTIENMNSLDDTTKEIIQIELEKKEKGEVACVGRDEGTDDTRNKRRKANIPFDTLCTETEVPVLVPNSKNSGDVSLGEYQKQYTGTKDTFTRIRILYDVDAHLEQYASTSKKCMLTIEFSTTPSPF